MRKKNEETMREIISFAEAYYLKHYQSPSITKIAEGVGLARSTVYKYLVEMNERGLIEYDGKTIKTALTEKVKPSTNMVAIIGSISCGSPNIAEQNIEEYVSLPESMFGQGEFYILRARGESMIDAGIDSGDLVIIRKQQIANEGDIVVALVEDEVTLKRFYKDYKNERYILHPENKSMNDIYVDQCVIQGVAIKVIKNLS